ncbi:hypothetical protein PMAYCL1PPCAC_21784, partial [Pristionchus mayeri]
EFFIGFYTYCNGDGHGKWQGGPCDDDLFAKRASPSHRFWSTHSFEKRATIPLERTAFKVFFNKYKLDCTIGFVSVDDDEYAGLTCGGSLC